MNTPQPCSSCGFLYVDCMHEDDPTYMAECLKKMVMGEMKCSGYKNYRLVTQKEKWGG